MESNGLFIVLLLFLMAQVNAQLYDVHWLNGTEPTRPERDVQSSKQNIDIYCYNGTAKYLSTLWQTVKFQINIENDEFSQYLGENPEEVYKYYKISNDSNINPFLKNSYKTLSLDIFKPTCMAVNTTQNYNIEIHIHSFDISRVLMMIIGVSLIFASRTLSGKPVFFYLYYIVVDVSALFMDLVYYVTRFIPSRNLTYGLLIGGFVVGLYFVELIQSFVETYRAYLFLYRMCAVIAGFISFLICYSVGPPINQRKVMWTLQGVGFLVIVFSSQYREISTVVAVLSLGAKYFYEYIQGYWPIRLRMDMMVSTLQQQRAVTEELRSETSTRRKRIPVSVAVAEVLR